MTHVSWSQRISLFFRGRVDGLLDALEDPERCLHQVVLDMEEQLEAAKRAAARAMANERRLRDRVRDLRREVEELDQGARRAMSMGDEQGARDYLERAEQSRRQADDLDRQLADQERDSTRVKESVRRLDEKVAMAKREQQLLQAKIRQGEARRAMGKALGGVRQTNLASEFERLKDRLATTAEEDHAYLELDDELSGDDLRRRCNQEAVADAVEDRIAALRSEVGGGDTSGEAPDHPPGSAAA